MYAAYLEHPKQVDPEDAAILARLPRVLPVLLEAAQNEIEGNCRCYVYDESGFKIFNGNFSGISNFLTLTINVNGAKTDQNIHQKQEVND